MLTLASLSQMFIHYTNRHIYTSPLILHVKLVHESGLCVNHYQDNQYHSTKHEWKQPVDKCPLFYDMLNPLSTRPHQNVVWYNNLWWGFLKILNYVSKEREKFLQKMSPNLSQLNVAMVHRKYFRRNNVQILKLATYTKIEDHYFKCKLATF